MAYPISIMKYNDTARYASKYSTMNIFHEMLIIARQFAAIPVPKTIASRDICTSDLASDFAC